MTRFINAQPGSQSLCGTKSTTESLMQLCPESNDLRATAFSRHMDIKLFPTASASGRRLFRLSIRIRCSSGCLVTLARPLLPLVVGYFVCQLAFGIPVGASRDVFHPGDLVILEANIAWSVNVDS